jgi:hypothetical protein
LVRLPAEAAAGPRDGVPVAPTGIARGLRAGTCQLSGFFTSAPVGLDAGIDKRLRISALNRLAYQLLGITQTRYQVSET